VARFGIGFSFGGRFTTVPDVFLTVNADNLDLRPVTPLGTVAILGVGAGLFPPGVATSLPLGSGSPQRFITPSELLTMAEFAAKPFSELDRGAGTVLVVPVNKSTPSTFAINATGPSLLATLTSKGWGLKFNQIQVKIETGVLTLSIPTTTGTILEIFPYSGATAIADLVDAINQRSALVSAVWTAQGTPVNAAFAPMTGGTEPAAVTQDWSDALHALDGIRVNTIAIGSSSSTVWAMLADYAILKRLRGFFGRGLQNWNGTSNRATALANLKADAAAINAKRMMHVGLGMEGQPGYLATARYAALAATLDPSTPMTFRHLDVASLEARLDPDTEIGPVDGLHINGVAPPMSDPDAPSTFLVSRGLSTYTGSDNLYDREHSVLAAVDGIEDQVNAAMRQVALGREGTRATVVRAEAAMDQILNEATRQRAAVRINSYRPESIHGELVGMVLYISAAFTPIPPINFVPVSLQLEQTDIVVNFEVPLTV